MANAYVRFGGMWLLVVVGLAAFGASLGATLATYRFLGLVLGGVGLIVVGVFAEVKE